jgi:translation initiation factor IF-3
VNKAIRVPEVRVVNEDGQQLGVMPTDAARDIASRSGLDLVEISPNGQPPVVKIMDYGQFKYELKKKAASAKKTQHQSQVKEVKFRPQISDHDLDFKLRNARKFLFEGDKVKCTVMFRGREIVHTHVGRQLLDRVTELLSEFTSVEQRTFAPNRAVIDKLKAAEAAARAAEEAEEAAEDAAEQAGDAAEQAGDAVEQAGDAAEQAEEKAPEEGQGEALSEEERKSASGAEAASADTAAE